MNQSLILCNFQFPLWDSAYFLAGLSAGALGFQFPL